MQKIYRYLGAAMQNCVVSREQLHAVCSPKKDVIITRAFYGT